MYFEVLSFLFIGKKSLVIRSKGITGLEKIKFKPYRFHVNEKIQKYETSWIFHDISISQFVGSLNNWRSYRRRRIVCR